MTDIFTCIADNPWSPEKSAQACHPAAVEVGEQEDG